MLHRFIDFTDGDFMEFSGRFSTAEAFANRVLGGEGNASYRQKLVTAWTLWDADGLRGFNTMDNAATWLPAPLRAVADDIAASHFKQLSTMGLPWSDKLMMGGRGYILRTADGDVFLDAAVEKKTLYLSQIAVERTGVGLGSRIMEALRDYAADNGLDICVYKVCNKRYFSRFPWLHARDGGLTFAASAATLAADREVKRWGPAPS